MGKRRTGKSSHVKTRIKRKTKEQRLQKNKKKGGKAFKFSGKKKLNKSLGLPNLRQWKQRLIPTKPVVEDDDMETDDNFVQNTTEQLQKTKAKREDMLLGALRGNLPSNITRKKVVPNEHVQKNKKWYRRDLLRVVDAADIVVEVLDARDPMSCRSLSIEQRIISMKSNTSRNKRVVLLINKIDLIPSHILTQWMRVLRRDFPVIAFKANTQTQKTHLSQSKQKFSKGSHGMSQSVGGEALLQLFKNYSRNLKLKTSLKIAFIGYPNTGKSSIINSLKRTRSVATSSIPGFTTSLQEVKLDAKITLIDSPGVLLNEEDDSTSLVLKNALRIDQVDAISAVSGILGRVEASHLTEVYELMENFSTTEEFLFLVGRKRGKLKKGGVPDIESVAQTVLQDWNSGRIPFYVRPPEVDEDIDENDLTFVNNFSKEFQISNLDQVKGACNDNQRYVEFNNNNVPKPTQQDMEMA